MLDLAIVADLSIQLTAFFLRDPTTVGRQVELHDAMHWTSVR